MDGSFSIGANTWFYPHTDGTTPAIVGTSVRGDFLVAAGGGVNANRDGYWSVPDNSNGPGAGLNGYAGGSYGGWGGVTNTAGVTNGAARPPYGDAALPQYAGSPGSWINYGNWCGSGRGGGVIHVLAGGRMQIDGSLLANGGNGTLNGGSSGSGGSILLSSGRLLSGTGTLESRGATVPVHGWSLDDAHPGGGGRIAI